jgi:hypothetical protein
MLMTQAVITVSTLAAGLRDAYENVIERIAIKRVEEK